MKKEKIEQANKVNDAREGIIDKVEMKDGLQKNEMSVEAGDAVS